MRRIAPGEIDQARGARRRHADRVDQRKVLPRQLVADDAVEFGVETLRKLLCRLRQFLRSHIIGRRIDEIAGERGGIRHPRNIGDVDAVRRHQPDLGRFRLPVSAKTITAECESERREVGLIGGDIGETIDARRQQTRQLAGPERIAEFGGLIVQPEDHLCDLTIGVGQRQVCARLGRKSVGAGELSGGFGKSGGDCIPSRRCRKRNGNGRRRG